MLPIEQVYTRLKIVSREKSGNRSKTDEVNVFDIFETSEKGEVVMTLVEGSPGIGKTTFCLKLAYDWAHGNIPSECFFPKFEVVFLLKCRDIDGDIMEAIGEQLLPRDMEKSVEKFLKDIYNQERLLIILDGLDELPEQSRHNVEELLHRRILPRCFVLATTRQERGIEVRKSFDFNSHLEIRGYTEGDAIAYMRRHFEAIGQSPKGESLIEEMQQNTFLHRLRNNPLNLLLLCVVYEDYEGKLPTSRTELYQVIVQCLLRRYCAKRNQPAPRNDIALERKFEKEILALGELAWLCLLSDRYGFRESELDEFESRYPGLVARELGLLYKEESLKRLKPQHEYCFLHKSFQEYVAAAYIAEKLENQQFNVFKHLYISFHNILTKYPQVFIFVSGMLGEKATVLFNQIGETLKMSNDWDWKKNCTHVAATFFIESINESGHPEKMAATLCKIIPFPKVLTLGSYYGDDENEYNSDSSFVKVLMACKSFSNLQTPVEIYGDPVLLEEGGSRVLDYIESCPQLTVLSLFHDSDCDADRLCQWFSATKSLSQFTYKLKFHHTRKDHNLLVQIGHSLASCRTLTKVKFSLPGCALSEGFVNALKTGLTPLMSVALELRGSMKYTATRVLQNFLSNVSLNSLCLCIVGEVQDLLVSAVSEALARQTVLKSLDLHFGGPLSSSSASYLEKGLMENSSLNDIRLRVHGEVPGNWHSVVENLRSARKFPVCCSIYPNTFNNVANKYFRPVLVRKGLNVKQHLTVNVWGEMKCEAAEALCEVLAPSSITVLTLNVRGNLTSEVSNSIARCLEENKTLSSLSINLWGELTTEGGITPSSLSKDNRVQLNVRDVHLGPAGSNNVLVISTDNPAAFRAFFTKVKDRRKEKVSLTINNDTCVTKEWTRCLGDALAENSFLTTLDLTVNSCLMDADLGENLGESLLQSTSLTSLSLTFNYSNIKEGWECKLGERLIKMASLTTLSLNLNGDDVWNQEDFLSPTHNLDDSEENQENSSSSSLSFDDGEESQENSLSPTLSSLDDGEENQENSLSPTLRLDDGEENQQNPLSPTKLSDVLVAIKSLSSLSVAIHSENMRSFWNKVVGDCLRECTSLEKLTLTFNVDDFFKSNLYGLTEGLAITTSLNTLNVAVLAPYHFGELSLLPFDLTGLLSSNSSVNTLTLTVTVNEPDDWYMNGMLDRIDLSENTLITTLNLTINEHGEGESDIPEVLDHSKVFQSLARNSSVTTFNLTLNSSKEVSDKWLPDLCDALKKNTSLTTLRLKVNSHCSTGDNSLYDFSKLVIESKTLALLELEVSFYGKDSGN